MHRFVKPQGKLSILLTHMINPPNVYGAMRKIPMDNRLIFLYYPLLVPRLGYPKDGYRFKDAKLMDP